jgi:hypothetical protein
MKQVKEKITQLRNIYTGEVVKTSNLFEKRIDGNMTFIQVFTEQNPDRKYFVNQEAFVSMTNK